MALLMRRLAVGEFSSSSISGGAWLSENLKVHFAIPKNLSMLKIVN